jgi:hypothetical protein
MMRIGSGDEVDVSRMHLEGYRWSRQD